MKDTELYAQLLGLRAPWQVTDVDFSPQQRSVMVKVSAEEGANWCCPQCGQPAPRYDKRARQWRHLDTMQFKTLLEAEVPRIQCPEHGVLQAKVPWAEAGSGFTALFEAMAVFWLKQASTKSVLNKAPSERPSSEPTSPAEPDQAGNRPFCLFLCSTCAVRTAKIQAQKSNNQRISHFRL